MTVSKPVVAQTSLRGVKNSRMYSVPEVAELLSVSKSLVYRAATDEGEMGFVRLGTRGAIRISGAEVKRWVRNRWGKDALKQSHAARSKNTTPVNGNRVREFRAKRNLSLAQLAEVSGVSKPTISRIERDGTDAGLRIENARALAKALKIKPRTLGVKEEAYA